MWAASERGSDPDFTCRQLGPAVIFTVMLFPDLSDRVDEVRARVDDAVARGGRGQSVRIVAVTKTHPVSAVRAVLECGLADVGENRIQEALFKISEVAGLPVRWHLIGHLQRNKVKDVDPFHLLHALDSSRLADALDRWGQGRGRPVDVLVQVNVSEETSKGGFRIPELAAEAARLRDMPGLLVRGVMTMAPYEAPEGVLRAVFSGARAARDVLRAEGHPADELSMGMSGDYEIAVEEGATIVRLGTILFGARS